jgi:hypothetical protein
MADRLAEIRDVVTRDYEEVRALIARLGEDTLARRTSNGWTASQLAGHIAGSPNGHVFVISRLRNGRSAAFPKPLGFMVNLLNWWTARRFRSAAKTALLQAAEDNYNRLIATINGISEDELDRGGDVLSLGKMTMYEYLVRSGDHGREHAAELRKAAGI